MALAEGDCRRIGHRHNRRAAYDAEMSSKGQPSRCGVKARIYRAGLQRLTSKVSLYTNRTILELPANGQGVRHSRLPLTLTEVG
jgi:hypothetical protein